MHLLAQASTWVQPNVDYHALAPEIVLTAAIVVLLLVDLFLDERQKWATSSIAGLGLLASLIPVLTLAVDGGDRSMFGGAFVVDNFSLVVKALFIITGYVVVLHLDELHRRGRLLRGRVLHAAALLDPRHGRDRVVTRPRLAVRRARAAVDPRLHARRVAQARPQEQRSGHEVLPARRVRLGRDALRHVAALRRHRLDAARRRSARSSTDRRPTAADRHARRSCS